MYSRIVVGTDGTDRSLIAVDHAARLAAACSAELHVVAAASPNDTDRESETVTARALLSGTSAQMAAKIGHDASKRHGVRVIEHPQIGDPATVLMAVAEAVDADLIVVGNRSVTGRGRQFATSVPSRLAHQSDRPILIVHTG
jgi:nucleotide-binding universal stress UspA family protein